MRRETTRISAGVMALFALAARAGACSIGTLAIRNLSV